MLMECSGGPSIDWQRRWFIRRLINFKKNTLDKRPYPDWYMQNPTHCNSTRQPILPSTTPETYICEPDFEWDPSYNKTLYDTGKLIFRQTIKVPLHEFVLGTNMDISTTPKRRDDTSYVPIPHAEEEEHDNEVSILATPPPSTIRPILKNDNNSTPTVYQSSQKLSATTRDSGNHDVVPHESRES